VFPTRSLKPLCPVVLRLTLVLVGATLLTACSDHVEGLWTYSCERSALVPDGDRCHARLELEHNTLAVIPEADGWLLAASWIGEDYHLIQANFDIPGLRKTVRQEDGYCAGPTCWIEFSDAEISRISQRGVWRIEVTRVFESETGGMRRGTRGLHTTSRGLSDVLSTLRETPAP